MDQQALFNLYVFLVVSIVAQSILAWELGYNGMARISQEGPSAKVIAAFVLFGIQVIWQRLSDLESPFTSIQDAWPLVIGVAVFLVARSRRPASVS